MTSLPLSPTGSTSLRWGAVKKYNIEIGAPYIADGKLKDVPDGTVFVVKSVGLARKVNSSRNQLAVLNLTPLNPASGIRDLQLKESIYNEFPVHHPTSRLKLPVTLKGLFQMLSSQGVNPGLATPPQWGRLPKSEVIPGKLYTLDAPPPHYLPSDPFQATGTKHFRFNPTEYMAFKPVVPHPNGVTITHRAVDASGQVAVDTFVRNA
jgi:hypothetical protein